MDGVLVVDKPSGWTSHDVVARVRRLLRTAKAGHTGTLDPLATGVLVVCVGKATRIARYLESDDKEYEAEIRLGTVTDTLDSEGRVLETRRYIPPAEALLRSVLREFTGTIRQRPPAYSAIKVNGVPSYRLARAGEAQELPEREVTVSELELLQYQDPCIRFRVSCSKGTYIRSLGAAIGDRLDAGACLTALVRTRAGKFTLQNAVSLERLAGLAAAGEAGTLLLPFADVLDGFPAVELNDEDSRRVAHGNSCAAPGNLKDGAAEVRVRLFSRQGALLAVGRVLQSEIRPEVVFA